MVEYFIFIFAIGALVLGADWVVEESEKIATHFNISEFIIGATLVALGTSLPEMSASMFASGAGKGEMAVGNVIGSNIMNIALVLGIVFTISKKELIPKRDIFAKDSAWGLIPLVAFILVVFDGVITRFEGLLLIGFMLAYILFLVNNDDKIDEVVDDAIDKKFEWKKTSLLLFGGFIMLVVGAKFVVSSASSIALSWGVSEWVIGLILIALGTSLPELAVSLKAAKKGNGDMIMGGIIGSSVANITIVLGSAALVNPIMIVVEKSLFDIVALISISVMFVFLTANRLYNKSAGISLLLVLSIVIAHSFS